MNTRFSCWSCVEYGFTEYEESPVCFSDQQGFPNIGDKCPLFVYEPGSDEEERDE